MRKYMIISLIVVLLLTVSTGVFAFGPGYGRGGGMGYCNLGNIPPEQTQKYVELQKQILPLRQKMVALKTDLAALYAQTAPDWNAIAQKQKEIVDLRIAIQRTANEAGFIGPGRCLQQNVRGGYCSPMQGKQKVGLGRFSF